jgi:hypothetical protein
MAAITCVLLAMGAAWSADPASSPSSSQGAPSKEMREKMATLHEHMAACLRSDKSVTECRTQMLQNCKETMGNQNCPMMGMGGNMGMGRGHMTPAPASAPSAK